MKQSTLLSLSLEDTSRWIERYRQRFIFVALNYVRDLMVAEDIVSDSFLSYWESRDRLPDDTNVPGYLMVTVKNKCLNWLKQHEVHSRVEKDIYTIHQRVILSGIKSLEHCNPQKLYDNEIEGIIEREFKKMPDLTRRVFVASREEDKTHREIASALNISTRKVNYEIQKAVEIFRKALKDYVVAILVFAGLLS